MKSIVSVLFVFSLLSALLAFTNYFEKQTPMFFILFLVFGLLSVVASCV